MILQSRKKHLTTQPNTLPATSRSGLRSVIGWTCRATILLVLAEPAFAATNLQWGRPAVVERPARVQQQHGHARLVRDASVVAAAWEADSQPQVQQTGALERSAAEPTPAYDPFEEDDAVAERLVQLPDDPFNDPSGELIPESNSEPDLESVEDALEKEIQRRESREDIFETPTQEEPEEAEEVEDVEEPEIPARRDPLEELDESELFDDDDQEMLDMKEEDFDLNLDFENRNKARDADGTGLTEEELDEQRKSLEKERLESEESCRQELLEIESDLISNIDLSIRVEGNAGEDYPHECAVSTKQHQPRHWPEVTYNWKASALCHKPLYFEQVQLERYGHSWGPYVQPIMSGAHFFGTLPILPYKMGIRTPRECVYALGYYRPGSCAPYMIDPVPFTWRAALFQGGAAAGAALVIP